MKRTSCWRRLVVLATACSGATTYTQGAFNIEFDYSYDSGGFFRRPDHNSACRRNDHQHFDRERGTVHRGDKRTAGDWNETD